MAKVKNEKQLENLSGDFNADFSSDSFADVDDPAASIEVEKEELPNIKLELEFHGCKYRVRMVNTKSITLLSTRIAEEEYRRNYPDSKATQRQILKYLSEADNETLMMAIGLNIAWEGARGAPPMSEVFEYDDITVEDRQEILAGVYFFEQKNRRSVRTREK